MGKKKGFSKLALGGVAAVVVIIALLALFSVKVVPAGHTGIKVTLGSVKEETLQEGVHFKIPFISKIVLTDNRTQIATVEGSSASKDLQSVDTAIAVNFRVNGTDSAKLYKNVGTSYVETIITPSIQEATKSVFARYTAEELITKRSEVGISIKAELENKVKDYGILIENLNITNCDFSEEFNKAIEAKQTATQEALKAQENTVKIQEEAKQKVIQAEAEAKANKILSESITENLIKMKEAEARLEHGWVTVNGASAVVKEK